MTPVADAATRVLPIPYSAEILPLAYDDTVYPLPKRNVTYPRSASDRPNESATDGHVTPGTEIDVPNSTKPKAKTRKRRFWRVTSRHYQ
jgi:hypothetical protein